MTQTPLLESQLRQISDFLATNRQTEGRTCRFDVVSIAGEVGREEVQWISDAFDAG